MYFFSSLASFLLMYSTTIIRDLQRGTSWSSLFPFNIPFFITCQWMLPVAEQDWKAVGLYWWLFTLVELLSPSAGVIWLVPAGALCKLNLLIKLFPIWHTQLLLARLLTTHNVKTFYFHSFTWLPPFIGWNFLRSTEWFNPDRNLSPMLCRVQFSLLPCPWF